MKDAPFKLAWELRKSLKMKSRLYGQICVIKIIGTKLTATFAYAPWFESGFTSGHKWISLNTEVSRQPANEKELEQFRKWKPFSKNIMRTSFMDKRPPSRWSLWYTGSEAAHEKRTKTPTTFCHGMMTEPNTQN